MKTWFFTLFSFALALPTVAATFTLTDITNPNGGTTNAVSPFTSVNIPNGTAGDGLAWTNVGAQINPDGPGGVDLGFYGSFSCPTVGGCSDTFEVDYSAAGYLSGTTTYVALNGFGSGAFTQVQAFGFGNQSLGYISTNASEFSVSSNPILLGSPSDSSGALLISIALQDGGTVNLPGGVTADLLVTQGSGVPEPGTLAIVAACGLLLFYVKRLRKA
jgi:hypothetical protein